MKRKSVLVIAIVIPASLGACSPPPDDKLKERVKRELSDPASAQFRDLELHHSKLCLKGEVNAKNRMGGYVGFKPFFARDSEVLIAESGVERVQVLSKFLHCG